MTKLEAVNDIRKALLELISIQDIIADDDEAVRAFHGSYERLVDMSCPRLEGGESTCS